MKLTVLHVFNATPILTQIINERRTLPLKGAYRVARMHAKLVAEFQMIAQKRDALILAYGYNGPDDLPPAPQVPPDKIEEFSARWADLASEEIEIDVEPIPLSQLDLGDDEAGSITALELISLGPLVVDDTAEPVAKAA